MRGDTDQAYTFHKGDLAKALAELDTFAEGATFLLGHNLIAFDLPHLAAAKPDLRLLKLPAVDTLRLNPLAFPRNPYHHLVKHYQDGQLKRGRLNDPELDARLTLEVFRDQHRALRASEGRRAGSVAAWHWLTTADDTASGLNAFFATLRRKLRPTDVGGHGRDRAMSGWSGVPDSHAHEILADAANQGWPLAYALGLAVGGGRQLGDAAVGAASVSRSGRVGAPPARYRLHRPGLRLVPRAARCAQGTRRAGSAFGFPPGAGWATMAARCSRPSSRRRWRGEHVLGILPTGTGKSLCYQIPALSRYDKTGALTVVISPLVALMADQVAGLEARGITSCAAINGLLSMPERADVLDRVRLGDVGILIVSPEQLRSRALRKVLAQREIGAWVLDEAHCLSKWGHDFRPDYRYVGRFIKEKAGKEPVPPVLCLTATAKPDVVADILGHFQDKLGIELRVFDGGASRTNLDFAVVPTTPAEKLAHIHQVLLADLPPSIRAAPSCIARRASGPKRWRRFCSAKGIAAGYFHAGLPPETQEERAGALHPRRTAGDRRHQRLRHGHRQAGCAPGDPCRHSRVRWRTICRKPAAPGATARRRAACCSTRRRMSNGSSACRRARG